MIRTFLVLLAVPMVAAADAPKTKVAVIVVFASEDGDAPDPRLKNIADEVRKLNPNLKSFRIKSTTIRDLPENEKATFPLVDMKSVEITVKQAMDKEGKTTLAVAPPDQGEIVFRLAANKYLPIVTRVQTERKERVILAIRVQRD
ncbi:MAG: hypothetical protein K2X38_09430 [Gemmataceae bacterium]|nr:hypothetical protein [Gemmataceae bacterium]